MLSLQNYSSDLAPLHFVMLPKLKNSFAEPHHFYAVPAPGTIFDAAARLRLLLLPYHIASSLFKNEQELT
jgi:hypothetical protein